MSCIIKQQENTGHSQTKAMANGSIIVTGLPADVLTLKTLSNYGEQKLSSCLCFVQNQLYSFEMEILTSQKGKPQLALDGYMYIIDKNDKKIYTGNVFRKSRMSGPSHIQ